MGLTITVLPVVPKDLPISPRFTPYNFLSRCKFSTVTTHQPIDKFYLPTFPRFPLRKKEHKSYFGRNQTHDFRTSRCAGYLLDHSGDEVQLLPSNDNSASFHLKTTLKPECPGSPELFRFLSTQTHTQIRVSRVSVIFRSNLSTCDLNPQDFFLRTPN